MVRPGISSQPGQKKADEAVVSLLGMTEDQFRQVVVLPQGQFRKFLAAGSDDREDLLERLFKTARFRNIGEELETRSRRVQTEFSSTRTERDALLTSLDVTSPDDLSAKISSLEDESKGASSGVQELENKHAAASVSLQTARKQYELREEFSRVGTRRQVLEGSLSAHEALVLRLEANRRSQVVLQIDSAVSAIAADLSRLSLDRVTAEKSLPQFLDMLAAATTAVASVESRRTSISDAMVRRENLRLIYENVVSLNKERDQLSVQQKSLADLTAAEKAKLQALEYLRASRVALDTEILRLSELGSSEGRIKAEIELLRKQIADSAQTVKLADSLVAQSSALAKESAAFDAANALVLKAQEELTRTKLAYHRSQAARLAAELRDGEPCPVCGSPDHPAPAHAATGELVASKSKTARFAVAAAPVDEVQVEAAEAELEKLKTKRTAAESSRQRVQSEIERLRESLAGVTIDSARLAQTALEARLKPLEAQLTDAKKAAGDLAAAKSKLELLSRTTVAAEAAAKQTNADVAEYRTLIAGTESTIKSLEAAVPLELRDLAKVKQEGVELKMRIDAFNDEARVSTAKLEAANAQVTQLKSRIETLKQEIDMKTAELKSGESQRAKALASSDFKTLEDARKAAVKNDELASLEKRRRDFDTEWATVQSRLQEIEKLLSKDIIDRPRLDALEAEFIFVDQQRTQILAQAMSLTERLASLKTSEEKIRSLQKRVTALEKQYSVIGRLADAAAGRSPNLSRVGFQRYVLGSRLDEVLEQASRRLHTMSRGQFILKRSTQVDDKRKNAGLDLLVEDALSGTTRPTASLSGGEGFLASLALALGLADVVQNHLGGVRLDAVFVDEGFGTLDPEALEQAMRVLTDLQAGGRLVGIISHVPELRDQIAKRLVIKKALEGSTVSWEG